MPYLGAVRTRSGLDEMQPLCTRQGYKKGPVCLPAADARRRSGDLGPSG